ATNRARSENRESLIARLQEVFLSRTYEEWEALLLPAGIPLGAINSIDRVVEHPQVEARGVLADYEHPAAGRMRSVSPYFRMAECARRRHCSDSTPTRSCAMISACPAARSRGCAEPGPSAEEAEGPDSKSLPRLSGADGRWYIHPPPRPPAGGASGIRADLA